MHIVYVTPGFIDNMGPTTGLPKYLLRVSMALIEYGHEVTIITCSDRNVVYDFFGIHVRRVRRMNIISGENEILSEIMRDAFIVHEEIVTLMKHTKIDIIQYASLSGIAFLHDFKIPSVVRLSSYASMWPNDGKERQQCIIAKMERAAAKKCNAIFGPSMVVANKFASDTGLEVEVIETPFLLETTQEVDDVYNSLFLNKEYILFYGTLVEYKGLGVIADSVYVILKENPHIHIGIIGSGNIHLVDEIIKRAEEYNNRVIYHEEISFSRLIPIIKNAQAVMLPSLMENFSNACIEAMALGKIVIGTRGASFDQLIDEGISGFLCEIGDTASLICAIKKVLSLDKKERHMMQINAKKRIDLLKPEIVVKQLIDYYNSVIESYHGL